MSDGSVGGSGKVKSVKQLRRLRGFAAGDARGCRPMAASENTRLATCETATVVVFRSLLYGPVVLFLLLPVCYFIRARTRARSQYTSSSFVPIK